MSNLPNIPKRFWQWYCNPHLQEQILGDLEEQFEDDLQALGLKKARRRFLWNVIRFFRKDIIRPISKSQKLNSLTMLKHHLKLTLRSFKRFKTSFAINLIGLSTGLACTLLIYLWVNDEWQMDKFHAFDPHLYQVLQNYDEGPEIETSETTPALLAEALLAESPLIEPATPAVPLGAYGTAGIVADEGTQRQGLAQHASAVYFSVASFQ